MLGFRHLRRFNQVTNGLQTTLGAAEHSKRCFAGGPSDVSSCYTVGDATNIKWHEGAVSRQQKEQQLGQRGCILWFTGLSGSGKSTVACMLEHALADAGHATALLDGDNIRHGLNSNLGFCAVDRCENIRRIGEVSRLFLQSGLITLVAFISPYRQDRKAVRDRVAPGDFIEIYMRAPLDVCEQRDPKGLYKAARAGKVKGFTGIDDPYEEPLTPELVLDARCPDGGLQSPVDQAAQILEYLRRHQYLQAAPATGDAR